MVQGSLLRVKLHPVFMEKERLFRRPESEGTINIFHQVFTGLTSSELAEYHLAGYSAQDFLWMPRNPGRDEKPDLQHKTGFCNWKKSLSQLGIPLPDIMRVLAGVMLVGNMQYDKPGDHCVTKLAALLGVTQASLVGGLWRRTQAVRGDLVTREVGRREWEVGRRGLASSLYLRTVNKIIKRINRQHMTDCDQVKDSTSFIGILDMFGWQSSLHGSTCSMEQLVMNTCSEHMQELYNTSVGIDTVPTMVCDVLLCVDRVTHSNGDSKELLTCLATTDAMIVQPGLDHSFTIHHYMGPVTYDSSNFIGKLAIRTIKKLSLFQILTETQCLLT